MESILSNLLLLAWLLPLASFCVILFFGPRLGTAGRGAAFVATGAIVSGFALSLTALILWVGTHGISGAHHADSADTHAADQALSPDSQVAIDPSAATVHLVAADHGDAHDDSHGDAHGGDHGHGAAGANHQHCLFGFFSIY